MLEGCGEEWVLLDREAREQAYLDALERLGEISSNHSKFSRGFSAAWSISHS